MIQTILLISYDLRTDSHGERDYKPLTDEIRRMGGEEVLASQWLVATEKYPVELLNQLSHLLRPEDRMLVSELTANAAFRPDTNPPRLLLAALART